MVLNFTPVAPRKLVPVRVTVAPIMPDVGVKLVTVGAGTVKFPALVPVPLGPVTLILPVVAPTGTVVVIDVAETTANDVTGMALNFTAVAPRKLVPVIVTVAIYTPEAGVKLVIVGIVGADTVKLAVLVPVPPGLVTLILPVVAPTGTVVVRDVAETTVNNVTGVVLNFTPVAPWKLVPVIVTVVPTAPDAGVKLVTVGGGTVKLAILVPVPLGPMTLILPVAAPTGTEVVIDVAETTVNGFAGTVLNITAVAPVKLVPLMITLVPTEPLVGVKLVIVGDKSTTMTTDAFISSPLLAVNVAVRGLAPSLRLLSATCQVVADG